MKKTLISGLAILFALSSFVGVAKAAQVTLTKPVKHLTVEFQKGKLTTVKGANNCKYVNNVVSLANPGVCTIGLKLPGIKNVNPVLVGVDHKKVIVSSVASYTKKHAGHFFKLTVVGTEKPVVKVN